MIVEYLSLPMQGAYVSQGAEVIIEARMKEATSLEGADLAMARTQRKSLEGASGEQLSTPGTKYAG
jgi:hypothetical protein